jgi:4,5-dihydroxyphthalate decarboxylase
MAEELARGAGRVRLRLLLKEWSAAAPAAPWLDAPPGFGIHCGTASHATNAPNHQLPAKRPMAEPKLRTVTRTQGNNQALKDGTVKPKTFAFDIVGVPVLIDGFRRMVRGNEFDICEMAITTYICAKAHGKPMTAVPVFLVRAFHHGAMLVNIKAGIRTPKDLEGRKVGVNRGYTVTTGLWARSILQDEYGVDLRKITWVLSGDEHVAEYRPPANVVPIEPGQKMADMLASGALAAAIGVELDHPDVKPLIPDALDAGLAALRGRAHYPINHTVVIRDDLLAARGDLAPDVFDAFAESKRLYVERLRAGKIEKPTAVDEVHRRVMEITGDPLPYGIAPNRRVLEELIRHSLAQGIITRPVTVEELFAKSTHDLTG